MTTQPMSANENLQADWDSASYHGIAENDEQPYRAQFSHGQLTPADDRDRDPVYENERFNPDPSESESTGRVRERVTNEWVASTGNQPIDPSTVSSFEVPSPKLPSTEVPSSEEALDVDQVEAVEAKSTGHSVSDHRRILPQRARRVADQVSTMVEPRPRYSEPLVDRHRSTASKPVEAEAHLNPRLEGRTFTSPETDRD